MNELDVREKKLKRELYLLSEEIRKIKKEMKLKKEELENIRGFSRKRKK